MSEVVRLRLPKIDPESLPEIVPPIGLFGSHSDAARLRPDDCQPSLEAYLYELHPGT
ncbi:MAG TPA: hypothetical protein VJQ77_08890 [Novosphingobium sp.]|nr:hypothetical protein [Novosphingobium sp.]